MRIESWNPNKFDETFENVAIERAVEAAKVIAQRARDKCAVGLIERPVYKRGPYRGRSWTSRDKGRLKKSIRVVRKKTKSGKAFSRKRSVRVYAGHYTAYYVAWEEEFGSPKRRAHPFLRPAFYQSLGDIKNIIGVK